MQNGKQYVSVSGQAVLTRDRDELKTHWRPDLARWFENGKDEDLALIKVSPEYGEYWDGSGLSKQVQYAAEDVAAAINSDYTADAKDVIDHKKIAFKS